LISLPARGAVSREKKNCKIQGRRRLDEVNH
jgi:hypothetical protein